MKALQTLTGKKQKRVFFSVLELVRNREEKPIGSRWHFASKYGPNGEVSRFKAGFFAKGFNQVEGADFSQNLFTYH